MTAYRLRYARIATLAGLVPVESEVAHYFRRTGRDRRHGWVVWQLVGDFNHRPATEWRTLEGVTKFLDANPSLREEFDIVEVPA